MDKEIKQKVKEFWDAEREHKNKGYACSGCKILSDYSHYMFADFLFNVLNLWDKEIDRGEFDEYCHELLKQGEEFIKSID